jgi:hypothetical protein
MRSGAYDFLAQDRVVFGRPAPEAVVETVGRLGRSRVLIAASDALAKPGGVVGRSKMHWGRRMPACTTASLSTCRAARSSPSSRRSSDSDRISS